MSSLGLVLEIHYCSLGLLCEKSDCLVIEPKSRLEFPLWAFFGQFLGLTKGKYNKPFPKELIQNVLGEQQVVLGPNSSDQD